MIIRKYEMSNINIFSLDDRGINRFGRYIFIVQFVCIILWLTNFYLHVPLAINGSLISIIFVILGIIFTVFHLIIIYNIYQDYKDKKIYKLNI